MPDSNNTLVRTLSVDEIFQKCGKNFYLEKVDGMLKLKQTHRYYMQVQGELGVMNKQWCDFVVYTESKDGVFVECVYFDDDFEEENSVSEVDGIFQGTFSTRNLVSEVPACCGTNFSLAHTKH